MYRVRQATYSGYADKPRVFCFSAPAAAIQEIAIHRMRPKGVDAHRIRRNGPKSSRGEFALRGQALTHATAGLAGSLTPVGAHNQDRDH